MSTHKCPCGTEKEFKDCCEPFLKGKADPGSAEELLRSRYSAFATGTIDYILETHHSKTRKDVKRDEIADWSKNSEWLGLNVAQVEAGGPGDEKGTIVFCAKYRPKKGEGPEDEKGKEQEHWEQAIFEKEKGKWRFLDARGVHVGTYKRAEPKIGRNDPCPCGSGQKFKKCCLKEGQLKTS